MRERSFEILEAAIREFITTGEPVSSSLLFERYNFGIRPAMIRAELSWLTENGYLEQPYHSAGRVPSNKGYEFFASRVLKEKKPQNLKDDMAESFTGGKFDQFLSGLSEELGIATAVGRAKGVTHKEGLEPLMENLAWDSREAMLSVIHDFESIDEHLSALRNKIFTNEFLNVFIGKKSPVTRSDDLAVMTGDYEIGGERVFLIAIGPKRMNYEKTAAIFKALKQISNI
jgi:transcriptional regulator of heat shock response